MTNSGGSGIDLRAGTLRLTIVRSEARFVVDGGGETGGIGPTTAAIGPPGATVGCGRDVELRLLGPGTIRVSLEHVVLRPTKHQWTATDRSKHGTFVAAQGDRSGLWKRLPRDVPVPIAPGMSLGIGDGIVLDVDVVRSPGA